MMGGRDGLVVKLSDYGFATAREKSDALGRRASNFTAPELRQVETVLDTFPASGPFAH